MNDLNTSPCRPYALGDVFFCAPRLLDPDALNYSPVFTWLGSGTKTGLGLVLMKAAPLLYF